MKRIHRNVVAQHETCAKKLKGENVPRYKFPVQPLGGDSFDVMLAEQCARVHQIKAGIAREIGVDSYRQDLFKVAVADDGSDVREDDMEAQMLGDNEAIHAGELVTLSVREKLSWKTFPRATVALSEAGMVATVRNKDCVENWSLVTTGEEIVEGRHYWEVEIVSTVVKTMFVGVATPQLKPTGRYTARDCESSWFVSASYGALFGNYKQGDHAAGAYTQGDRVGMLIDLDDGSLRFFKNGVLHGPGYPAGSIIGPVVHAVNTMQLSLGRSDAQRAFRLLPAAPCPYLPKPEPENDLVRAAAGNSEALAIAQRRATQTIATIEMD
jgi:hypothetical protein